MLIDNELVKIQQLPGHPDADAEGFVLMPNVQLPIEMVNLLTAATAQVAVTAIGTATTVLDTALNAVVKTTLTATGAIDLNALAQSDDGRFAGVYVSSAHLKQAFDVGKLLQNERILQGDA